jgi:hypothetical protein
MLSSFLAPQKCTPNSPPPHLPPPTALHPHQVLRRRLGSPPKEDALLFEEPDPSHFVSLTRTKDWRYLLVNSHAKLSSEVRAGASCWARRPFNKGWMYLVNADRPHPSRPLPLPATPRSGCLTPGTQRRRPSASPRASAG